VVVDAAPLATGLLPTRDNSSEVRKPKNMSGLPTLPGVFSPHMYFVSATVDAAKMVQADYVHQLLPCLRWKWYASSTITDIKDAIISTSVVYEGDNRSVQVKAQSHNMLVGVNVLQAVSAHWALGSEAFYSRTEASGSASVGTRYQNKHAVYPTYWTNTLNIFGEATTTVTSTVVPNTLTLAARLAFNFNNYASGFAVGAEYKVKQWPVLLKAKYDTKGDGALMASFPIKNGGLHFGLSRKESQIAFGMHYEM